MQPNIVSELRNHTTAVGPLKKAAFPHAHLDLEYEEIYAGALTGSKLWYNAATWPKLFSPQFQMLNKSLTKCVTPRSGVEGSTRNTVKHPLQPCAQKLMSPLVILNLFGVGLGTLVDFMNICLHN